jgi:hypothetical protein
MNESVTMLGDIASKATGTLSAQAKFVAAFSGGFSS